MLRGTRIIEFEESKEFVNSIDRIRSIKSESGIEELIFPSLLETSTFDAKLGAEKEPQIWRFQDRKTRECCLFPEVTGMA